jgi:hypothetical protein
LSRELIYRLSIQTNDAKRQAANIRSTFERELRQIQAGNINFSAATGQARQLSAELNNVAASGQKVKAALPGGTDFFSAGINDAIAQVQNLATAYIGLQGITAVIDLSKLGTQAQRTYASLNILAGGGEKAEEVLKAIQKASNGTVTEMEAAGIATQGFALKLARTPAEFEKLTRAAREIVQVSPIINDVSEALTQLALFASNEQSFARADQLGLAVGEVKDRMAELRRENDALSGSQANCLPPSNYLMRNTAQRWTQSKRKRPVLKNCALLGRMRRFPLPQPILGLGRNSSQLIDSPIVSLIASASCRAITPICKLLPTASRGLLELSKTERPPFSFQRIRSRRSTS